MDFIKRLWSPEPLDRYRVFGINAVIGALMLVGAVFGVVARADGEAVPLLAVVAMFGIGLLLAVGWLPAVRGHVSERKVVVAQGIALCGAVVVYASVVSYAVITAQWRIAHTPGVLTLLTIYGVRLVIEHRSGRLATRRALHIALAAGVLADAYVLLLVFVRMANLLGS